MEESPPTFAISLKENGLYSLGHGIRLYRRYLRTRDKMELRNAIMFLHHGVELLMKEILVSRSEYLIFEDLQDVTRKQKKADSLRTGIFLLDKPPRTVTYLDAVARVEAFVKPPELNQKLIADLEKLNRVRNQLEHYGIEVDLDDVTKLLASLHEPLLDLFEAQIGGVKDTEPARVKKAWRAVEDRAHLEARAEEQVAALMERFAGQIVPGSLFGRGGEMTLPVFRKVIKADRRQGFFHAGCHPDLIGESEDGTWIVEVKSHASLGEHPSRRIKDFLYDCGPTWDEHKENVTLWFVALAELPDSLGDFIDTYGMLITGHRDLFALAQLLGAEVEVLTN